MPALPQNSETMDRIRSIKAGLGKELIILTHHYQRKEIVDLGDFAGDSFELSRKAALQGDCRYIVFCGVHFMAESAAIDRIRLLASSKHFDDLHAVAGMQVRTGNKTNIAGFQFC